MPARFVPQVCGKPNSGCHPGAPPQPSHVGAVGTAVPTWGVLSIISSQAEAGTRAVAPRRSPEGDGYIIKASSCPKFLRLLGVRLWRWRQLMRPSPYSCAQTPTESNAPWAPRDASMHNQRGYGEGSATRCTRHRRWSQKQPQQLRPQGT